MLPLLECTYNNSLHSVMYVSPFRAVQGVDPIVPASLLLSVATGAPQPQTYAELTHSRLQIIWAAIRESEVKQARQVQARENKRRGPKRRLNEGDEVSCRKFQLAGLEGKRKQELQYEGPFRVKKMIKG